VEEILETETTISKEVEAARETLNALVEVWKNVMQHASASSGRARGECWGPIGHAFSKINLEEILKEKSKYIRTAQ
jgi:hypothetical protein